MNMSEKGQVLVLVGFFMILMLYFIFVISDLFLVYQRQQELTRFADCAAKSGMIIVGDALMTQAAESPASGSGGSFCSNEMARGTIIAPPMQTAVTADINSVLAELDPYSPLEIGVIYPYRNSSHNADLRLYLSIGQKMNLPFGSLEGIEGLVISGESEQVILCP